MILAWRASGRSMRKWAKLSSNIIPVPCRFYFRIPLLFHPKCFRIPLKMANGEPQSKINRARTSGGGGGDRVSAIFREEGFFILFDGVSQITRMT